MENAYISCFTGAHVPRTVIHASEKRIPWAIYAPGRHISQLALEVVNRPGAMAAIAKLMGDLGINILSGCVWAEPGEERARWVFFVDLTGTGVGPDELAKRLRSLDVVSEAMVVEHRVGELAVDTYSFPIVFLTRRAVLLDVAGVAAMLDWIDRTFGSGGHAILFDMGHEAGRAITGALVAKFGLSKRSAFEAFMALCTAMGYFKYEITSFDPEERRATIRLYSSFECEPFRGRDNRPRSHLVRGMVAGALEVALGGPVSVREVKCVAKGDDYCEFVIEPRS